MNGFIEIVGRKDDGKENVYRIFTIADYEREALYFREMHAKGWKLRKVSYSILLFVVKKIYL